MNIARWDSEALENATQAVPNWFLPQLEEVCKLPAVVNSDRVSVGLGFDSYHLPQDQVAGILGAARDMGVKLITSHWRRNNIAGKSSLLSHLTTTHAAQAWASPSHKP